MGGTIVIGANEKGTQLALSLAMANRHGLIAGATGTGKTASLQLLAEGFSRAGVPVLVPDVKGDFSGIAASAELSEKLRERAERTGVQLTPAGAPTVFWDLEGVSGHPVRTTISEMGPLVFSRLLDLNDTQESVLSLAFSVADKEGLLLLDVADLESLLTYLSENRKVLSETFGNLSEASLSTIRRKVVELKSRGGDKLFGEPALQLSDLLHCDLNGAGVVNILDARRVVEDAKAYTSFLLWLMSELFEQLEEVGDREKPKLVMFFDEAHLLFKDASPALVEKVETVVRLIRSKGVGIYFVTQNPLDIPETILGQLGNRVQHALRAFTEKEQRSVRAVAKTFRQNAALDTEEVLQSLGVGEALVSFLEPGGAPSIVERVLVAPPSSRLGPLSLSERQNVVGRSPVGGKYDQAVDRVSAAETLAERRKKVAAEAPTAPVKEKPSVVETVIKQASQSFLRSLGSQIGREVMRGVLGGIMGRKR